MKRLFQWARSRLEALGAFPLVLLAAAALAVTAMYCGNNNLDGDPAAPRGDGKYRPVLARGDGHMHFLITRSLVFDHDLDLDNDLARFGDPWNQPRTVTGKKNVMQQIGPSLVWAPVLAGAHGLALVVNVFGGDIETHGYTLFHQRILFATSVVFACLAVALGLAVARRIWRGRWGPTWGALAVLLGTPLTYYATFMPSYAHAMDAAACAGFLALWVCTLGELRWRRYVWLGVLLGVATMVRIQDLGMGVVLALELGITAAHHVRASEPRAALGLVARGALTLAIALVLYTPQLYEWKQMYGSWWTTPQGPGQMRYAHAMVTELLFSPRNGWLSNTPIAYLGVIGLALGCAFGPRLDRRARLVCGALLLAVAIQVYVNAVTYEWWSGASFGQRRMCSMSLPLVVGIAALLRLASLRLRWPLRVKHAIAIAVLGYLIAWNLDWISRLRHGATAGRDNEPTCCSDIHAPLSWIARPVYAVIGNPFELPESAQFAIEHGVGLDRYDHVNGHYPLVPGVLGYQDGSYRNARGTWDTATAGAEPYLLGGFGPARKDGARKYRWTTAPHAELFISVLMPEPHRIVVPIAANAAPGEQVEVTIRDDGEGVVRTSIGAEWTTITFDTSGELGEHVITFEAEPRLYRGGPPLGAGTDTVMGVAIGPFSVGLPPRPR